MVQYSSLMEVIGWQQIDCCSQPFGSFQIRVCSSKLCDRFEILGAAGRAFHSYQPFNTETEAFRLLQLEGRAEP